MLSRSRRYSTASMQVGSTGSFLNTEHQEVERKERGRAKEEEGDTRMLNESSLCKVPNRVQTPRLAWVRKTQKAAANYAYTGAHCTPDVTDSPQGKGCLT